MLSKLRSWKASRDRAVCLGRGNSTYYWHDPQTDRVWMAGSRYSLAVTDVTEEDDPEATVDMLDIVASATLEVSPNYPDEVMVDVDK